MICWVLGANHTMSSNIDIQLNITTEPALLAMLKPTPCVASRLLKFAQIHKPSLFFRTC